MNKIQTIIVFIALATLLVGCSGTTIKHVSANEFLEIAKQIEKMNSATWTTYIGTSKTRAYLEYGDVLGIGQKTRTIVYWTELDKLPKETSEKLKSGISPWTPWEQQVKKGKS